MSSSIHREGGLGELDGGGSGPYVLGEVSGEEGGEGSGEGVGLVRCSASGFELGLEDGVCTENAKMKKKKMKMKMRL